jgi:hypothetical protein
MMSELHNEISTKDIMYILDNPWKLTESEWSLQHKSLLNDTLSDILRRLKLSFEDGYSKLWKTPNNEPIAILGGYKIQDKKYETFFIASYHMEEYALKLSFEMRNILNEKASIYKGFTCGLYSTSDHPSQITWFRFLGFKYIPEGDLGTTRYFEYKAPI